jgi:hypothetical protein
MGRKAGVIEGQGYGCPAAVFAPAPLLAGGTEISVIGRWRIPPGVITPLIAGNDRAAHRPGAANCMNPPPLHIRY